MLKNYKNFIITSSTKVSFVSLEALVISTTSLVSEDSIFDSILILIVGLQRERGVTIVYASVV
jgi:hypothetical protein